LIVRVVVADTNILINLGYADSLDLLALIPGIEFIIPPEVEREMRRGRGRVFATIFSRTIASGKLRVEEAIGPRAVEVYVRCRDEHHLDEGESAGLALAASRGDLFATTDARAYEAGIAELGEHAVVHLEDILELVVARDVLTGEAVAVMRQLMATRNGYRGWE
jgi:predicted nucleic acid-binding protein